MAQSYRNLQFVERCQIRSLHTQGVSISAIARSFGRGKSTICRGSRRSLGTTGYLHQEAQRLADLRSSAASSGSRTSLP